MTETRGPGEGPCPGQGGHCGCFSQNGWEGPSRGCGNGPRIKVRTPPAKGLWDGKRPHESLGTDWLWGLRWEEMTLGTDTFSHHCLCCIGQKLCLSSVGGQANRSNLLGNAPCPPHHHQRSESRVGLSSISPSAGSSRLGQVKSTHLLIHQSLGFAIITWLQEG